MFSLPKTATAPFCPSEVRGSVLVNAAQPLWRRLVKVAGPGLLVSVGYMDPGNWATDIEAGSKYGYSLLFIVLLSSITAMVLQTLCARLGLVTGKDLAQHCRAHYPKKMSIGLWLLAELAIIACDLAEILGSALALHLLFGLSLMTGVFITAFDMLIVLGLKGRGFRQIEAIVLGLILTIAICFAVQLCMLGLDQQAILQGFTPQATVLQNPGALFLAVGILGATVMPHNLYLHSSIVQTRHYANDEASKRDAIKLATWDTLICLVLAFFVNAAILIVAASAFHATGHQNVTEIDDAYHLLEPIVGTAFASLLFGVALLASGQSSTFTGTIAGQVVMEGFLNLKIPCWSRRLITRLIALVPAVIGISILGDNGVGQLLVLSQVVLSLQLPFAIWPLLQFTRSKQLMGNFANPPLLNRLVWMLFLVISAANLWLVWSFF